MGINPTKIRAYMPNKETYSSTRASWNFLEQTKDWKPVFVHFFQQPNLQSLPYHNLSLITLFQVVLQCKARRSLRGMGESCRRVPTARSQLHRVRHWLDRTGRCSCCNSHPWLRDEWSYIHPGEVLRQEAYMSVWLQAVMVDTPSLDNSEWCIQPGPIQTTGLAQGKYDRRKTRPKDPRKCFKLASCESEIHW